MVQKGRNEKGRIAWDTKMKRAEGSTGLGDKETPMKM